MGKSEKWLGTCGGCEDWHTVLFLGIFKISISCLYFLLGTFNPRASSILPWHYILDIPVTSDFT